MFLRPQANLSHSHFRQLRLLCLKNYIAEGPSKISGAHNTQKLLNAPYRCSLLHGDGV
jgi:hypothetical protein